LKCIDRSIVLASETRAGRGFPTNSIDRSHFFSYKEHHHVVTDAQNHKTTNFSHRRTRFESLESRLCLSGCGISGTVYDARFALPDNHQPLAGVHLFVDVNDSGVFDGDDPWTISNGNGDYSFQGLEPTSYPAEFTVYETAPIGYTATTPQVGYQTVSFSEEGNATDIDFGNTPDSSIVDLFVLADDTDTFSTEIAPALNRLNLTIYRVTVSFRDSRTGIL